MKNFKEKQLKDLKIAIGGEKPKYTKKTYDWGNVGDGEKGSFWSDTDLKFKKQR